MKTILSLFIALLLTGCGTQPSAYRTVNDQCNWTRTIPEWNNCVERANSREEVRVQRERARDDAFDDMAAASIIANGFSHPRSCMNIGGIVTCQ